MGEKNSKILITEVLRLAFLYSLFSFLFFYMIESIIPEFVESVYNLKYHLAFVIITGILNFFMTPAPSADTLNIPREKIRKRDLIIILILGVLVFLIILFRAYHLGWVSYLIALLSSIITILIALSLIFSSEE